MTEDKKYCYCWRLFMTGKHGRTCEFYTGEKND